MATATKNTLSPIHPYEFYPETLMHIQFVFMLCIKDWLKSQAADDI